MNQIDLTMELFDVHVRRLANGNKLSIIFEVIDNLELEKKLIEFRGSNVAVKMTQDIEPENKEDKIFIDSNFEVFDIKYRKLRNGDKLRLIFESLYDKFLEIQLVKLRFNDVKIFMEEIGELPFNQNDDMQHLDIEDPEKMED